MPCQPPGGGRPFPPGTDVFQQPARKTLGFRDLLRSGLAGSQRDYRRLIAFGLAGGALGMVSPFVTGLLVDWVLPSANRGELAQLVMMLALTAAGVAAFAFI